MFIAQILDLCTHSFNPLFITGGADDTWFTHMNSIKTFHYPICDKAEFIGTGNFYIAPKRMQHMVVLAMLAAEETFKIGQTKDVLKRSMGHAPVICDMKYDPEGATKSLSLGPV